MAISPASPGLGPVLVVAAFCSDHGGFGFDVVGEKVAGLSALGLLLHCRACRIPNSSTPRERPLHPGGLGVVLGSAAIATKGCSQLASHTSYRVLARDGLELDFDWELRAPIPCDPTAGTWCCFLGAGLKVHTPISSKWGSSGPLLDLAAVGCQELWMARIRLAGVQP